MDLLGYLEVRARMVEREIDRWVPRGIEPGVLAKAMGHLLRAGGKRLRPCLVLTACETVGGEARNAVETAAALELLHTFSLIHDDAMDRGKLRRNVKTVHVLWGEPIAIAAGDALFARVFEAIAANAKRLRLSGERTVELLNTVSKASSELCRGQVLDTLFKERRDVDEQEYFEMVRGKTGALFEASAKSGGLLGGGNPKEVKALAEYGCSLGIAFQIRDDVLDLTGGEKFGKPLGGDILGGKRSLPAVYALGTLRAKERSGLLRILGNRRASRRELRQAIGILRESGSIGRAAEKSLGFVARAKSKLRVLRDSEARRFLFDLADFSVRREL